MQNLIKSDTERLEKRVVQETSWMTKEVETLQQFEEYLFKLVDKLKVVDGDWEKTLTDQEINGIRQNIPEDKLCEADIWLVRTPKKNS